MIFTLFGLLVGKAGFEIVNIDTGHSVIHIIAELTLVLVLFSDAARLDVSRLRRDHNLPVRMLFIGLPLTLGIGALLAATIFPFLSIWEAALLAALLAPTDAALGQSVVSDRIVPVRVRQAINVESGLNDGVVLPVVLMLAALASSHQDTSGAGWIRFSLLQITLGPAIGVAIGYLGARLMDGSTMRAWMGPSFEGIAVLCLAFLAYSLAELVGGNGFISVFLAGMAFGKTLRHPCEFLFEFIETEGQFLMLITFLIFGVVLLPEGLLHFDIWVLIYALLSLTVVRMLPVALALIGTGVSLPTKLFLGWFGPRGLASILFVLLILDESSLAHADVLLSVTVLTVALSILLHGLSTSPLASLYGRLATRLGDCEENQPIFELPLREGLKNSDGKPEVRSKSS
jgi:sodium/hydrogen antiporter